MLSLSVSSQPCVPGRPMADAGPRPTACSTCKAPGGNGGVLLEKHLIGKGKARYLCPLCHAVLHLDVAGKMKAGRIVWIPELSQERLNLLVLVGFVALRKTGVHRGNESVKAIAEHARCLYKSFEKRAEAVETFLGGGAAKSPLPRHALSTPTHLASLITMAQKESKLNARTMAERLDGLRMLPNPAAFDGYIAQVSRLVTAQFPVTEWMGAVERHLAEEAAVVSPTEEGTEHFDAGESQQDERQATVSEA